MVATSYNGYPVISQYGDPRLVPLTANGKPFLPNPGVLKGDVATVLNYLADFLDREIEPLDLAGYDKDDWAFTPKTVTGGSGWSCHASATAFDYNAQKHGQGVAGTWQSWQIRAIDNFIQAELGGCVRWGEHWTGKSKDGMHFEIYGSPLALSVVAARIRNKPAPKPPTPAPAPLPKPPTDEELIMALSQETQAEIREIVRRTHTGRFIQLPWGAGKNTTTIELFPDLSYRVYSTGQKADAARELLAGMGLNVAPTVKNPAGITYEKLTLVGKEIK